MDKKLKLLHKLYTNTKSPSAFAGIDALYDEARKHEPTITKKDVIYYLEGNRTYTLHRPRRIHFKRSRTIPSGFMTDVQVDLADFQKLARHNEENKYILVGIDVLSKRLFAAPTKSKNFKDMKRAFENLFEQMPMLPHRIYSDRGTEFNMREKIKKDNKIEYADYFKDLDIQKFKSSTKTIKASLAERAIRNLKSRLYRLFSELKTLNWLKYLVQVVDGINHSYCRITKMRPIDVNFKNAQAVWENVFGKELTFEQGTASKHNVGSNVRMANYKETFDKGYLPNWSDEILTVAKVKRAKPDTYKVKDDKDEMFEGNFYAEDLGKTRKDAKTTYRIKVLKKRTRNGIREYYVKFIGYTDPPQWIPEKDIA